MRKRTQHRGLTSTRIYQKGNKFLYFSPEAIENPFTKKLQKWHPLCPISDGEDEARRIAKEIVKHNDLPGSGGDLPGHMETYRIRTLAKREAKRPKEPARQQIFDRANKEITRICNKIAEAFTDFDVEQVMPHDIATFIDQWEGQRMAEVYLSRLSDFFAWTCRKGIRNDNPCREVEIDERPKAKKTYITHQQFHAIRKALLTGKDKRDTASGPMVQCYVDLCYLLYQRTTDIRLLKWSQIDEAAGLIHFTPTKTEKSSGARVDWPITPDIRAVLERAKAMGVVKSIYVIHTLRGQPYGATGLRSAWARAGERVGLHGLTLKALRNKAMTDAKKAGYTIKQIAMGAAHTNEETAKKHYILDDTAPVSEIAMVLPPEDTET